MQNNKLAQVIIIGQANTGKSTLFNKIVKKRKSIEHNKPGVTRDYLKERVSFAGISFELIDTGGLFAGDDFEADVKLMVFSLMKEADLVVFLTDGKAEPTSLDFLIADHLRKNNIKHVLAVNKIDNERDKDKLFPFFKLGLDEPIAVSSAHKIGIENLLINIVEKLKQIDIKHSHFDNMIVPDYSIALIGKPNVGKSTLLNVITNQNRAIVSSIAGTTRDNVDTTIKRNDLIYKFVDTAGIRSKSRIKEQVESISRVKTITLFKEIDCVLFLIDATSTITDQDQKIASLIVESGISCIILINKWDLIKNKYENQLIFADEIRNRLKFFRFIPFLFISAKEKEGINDIFPKIEQVISNYKQKIATSAINKCLENALTYKAPPSFKGKRLKVFYALQTGNNPFILTAFVNNPKLVHFSYKRYLENKIRACFNLEGVQLRLIFKGKNRDRFLKDAE